jgi:hypothetical protein
MRLDEERQNGLSRLWIVGEFLAIVAVLAQRPNGHLVHAGGGKQVAGHTLGHDREREPGQEFVGVVGTRHETMESGKARLGLKLSKRAATRLLT